jgi:hypothetical protein
MGYRHANFDELLAHLGSQRMIGLGMTAGKDMLAVDHVQVVALYDPSSGRIRHLHMVTTLSGATPVSEDEAIAEAKARAGRRNADVRNLAVALSNEIEHGRRPHSIDPKTKAFVPLPGDG